MQPCTSIMCGALINPPNIDVYKPPVIVHLFAWFTMLRAHLSPRNLKEIDSHGNGRARDTAHTNNINLSPTRLILTAQFLTTRTSHLFCFFFGVCYQALCAKYDEQQKKIENAVLLLWFLRKFRRFIYGLEANLTPICISFFLIFFWFVAHKIALFVRCVFAKVFNKPTPYNVFGCYATVSRWKRVPDIALRVSLSVCLCVRCDGREKRVIEMQFNRNCIRFCPQVFYIFLLFTKRNGFGSFGAT